MSDSQTQRIELPGGRELRRIFSNRERAVRHLNDHFRSPEETWQYVPVYRAPSGDEVRDMDAYCAAIKAAIRLALETNLWIATKERTARPGGPAAAWKRCWLLLSPDGVFVVCNRDTVSTAMRRRYFRHETPSVTTIVQRGELEGFMHFRAGVRKLCFTLGTNEIRREDTKYQRTVYERVRPITPCDVAARAHEAGRSFVRWRQWRQSLPSCDALAAAEAPDA